MKWSYKDLKAVILTILQEVKTNTHDKWKGRYLSKKYKKSEMEILQLKNTIPEIKNSLGKFKEEWRQQRKMTVNLNTDQ